MYTESIAFNQDESNALRNVSMWLALTSIGNSLKRSSSDGTLTVRSAPCIWAAQCQSPRFCLPQPIRTYARKLPTRRAYGYVNEGQHACSGLAILCEGTTVTEIEGEREGSGLTGLETSTDSSPAACSPILASRAL